MDSSERSPVPSKHIDCTAADLGILRRLVTLHVRKDRLSDGHLKDMIAAGHIVAIVSRAGELMVNWRFIGPDGNEMLPRV
jgi:hypothetical protein